jgi:hypothetical protein
LAIEPEVSVQNWLAGRIRPLGHGVSASSLSLAADAEATADAGEPLYNAAEETAEETAEG